MLARLGESLSVKRGASMVGADAAVGTELKLSKSLASKPSPKPELATECMSIRSKIERCGEPVDEALAGKPGKTLLDGAKEPIDDIKYSPDC